MRFRLLTLLLSVTVSLSAAPTFRVGLPVPAGGASAWRTVDEKIGRPLWLALTDGLVTFDAVTGFAKPGLATAWAVGEGGRSWIFSLRAAKWSDGVALTAADFVASWTKAGIPTVSLDAPDARTLRVVFAEPVRDATVFAGFPYLLVPDPSQPKRGAGPFVFDSQEPGKPLVLVKNPRYREASLVKLDRLEFRFFATWDEAGAWYRDGLLDWLPRGGGPGIVVPKNLKHAVTAPGWGTVFLRLNLNLPQLGDAVYRQALSDSLDRTSIAQGLRGPQLVPSVTLVPPSTVPVQRAVAPRLMGPLPRPTLTILYPRGETYRSIAEEIAGQWKARLGIQAEPKAASWDLVRADRASGVYEAALGAWTGDYPDPMAFLEIFRSQGADNLTGFADPEYDRIVDSNALVPPGRERTAVLGRAASLLQAQVAVVPLLSYATVNQIDLRKWSGWTANPTDIHPWPGIGPKK